MGNRVTKSTSDPRNFFPLAGLKQSLHECMLPRLREVLQSRSLPEPDSIHLVRQHLRYSSPVACQLAKSDAATLARDLAASCNADRPTRAKATGWLEFELLRVEWSDWLSLGWQSLPMRGSSEETPLGGIGLHQYAHARCCAWLDLGCRTGLLAANTAPEAIPWERLLATPPPAQVALLGALMDLGDRAAAADIAAANDSLHLAAAVLAFQSSSPLWGELYLQAPELARARLGAIGVARNVLAALLARLDLPAPQVL